MPNSPSSDDPRWDRAGFDMYSRECAPFVHVGVLRSLLRQEAAKDAPWILYVSELPPDAGVVGAQVFAVLSPSLLKAHPDPLAELGAIVEVLAAAADNDFVYWDHLCSRPEDEMASAQVYRMFTHYRVQCIVLPATYGAQYTVFERLETMALLSLATFCQRLANRDDPAVQASIQLKKLMDLPNLLMGLHSDSDGGVGQVAEMLDRILPALTPVRYDAEGFRVFIEEANIAWLPYPYAKELASTPGPFPRRQCLNQSRLIVGKVPTGRKVVVSHGWDTAFHISPSGAKMRLVCEEMERIGAIADDDAIFIDFCVTPVASNRTPPPIALSQSSSCASRG